MQFIDLKTQYIELKSAIDARIRRVLDHGQYIMGPEVNELEERLAAYVGTRHCVAVASGTDALLIAMMSLGIEPGDEVITSPFTFIATAEMIAFLGAKPVFVDIDSRTYNIDPAQIESAISPRTKAIMPVSLYGQCADFEAINSIAREYQLPVIEDAAQSFGARYKGRMSCALSLIGCTSFFPSKPLGCYGDGGACFTDDDALARLMREIRVHGQDRRYHHPLIGVNGRMDTIQAAVLLAKLDTFPAEVETRGRLGATYNEQISASGPDVLVPYIEPYNSSVFAQYTIQIDNRASVQEGLKQRDVPTAIHYPVPLHLQPAFANLGLSIGSFPVAEATAKRVISLPMHPFLDSETQLRVISELSKVVQIIKQNLNRS
jgi:UDP-2-acetamido-2-deoxy-ribo-hexuluronate aminotransferase